VAEVRERDAPLATGLERNRASCHTCGKLGLPGEHVCDRCGSALHLRKPDSLQRCLAFSFAALIAYIPANLMPMMYVSELGVAKSSTILGGVATFWKMHAYAVASIIFIASVMIPGLKLISLVILCSAVKGWIPISGHLANRLYWLTELVGRWSMVDVFVVAVLVGLVQMGNLMSIRPGPAVVSFGLMVILTMIAAHSFEPKLVWDRLRSDESKDYGKR
jgi:paraquat-inducible protein A